MDLFRRSLSDEWFAVQVWAGREQLATHHLRQRGHVIFLPCYRERRRWSDRVKIVELALFPGYLFCRLGSRDVSKIVMSSKIIRVVGDSHGPIAIPDDEIEAIQRVVNAQLHATPFPTIPVGQRVRVDRGPLAGVEGVVLTTKKCHRLLIAVPLLQRTVAVEIDSNCLDLPHE